MSSSSSVKGVTTESIFESLYPRSPEWLALAESVARKWVEDERYAISVCVDQVTVHPLDNDKGRVYRYDYHLEVAFVLLEGQGGEVWTQTQALFAFIDSLPSELDGPVYLVLDRKNAFSNDINHGRGSLNSHLQAMSSMWRIRLVRYTWEDPQRILLMLSTVGLMDMVYTRGYGLI